VAVAVYAIRHFKWLKSVRSCVALWRVNYCMLILGLQGHSIVQNLRTKLLSLPVKEFWKWVNICEVINNSNSLPFYRTIMHSADYMPPQGVCPSVCHTPVFCRNGLPKCFHHLVAILVFFISNFRNFDEDPLTGASSAKGYRYEKIVIFDQYIALYRKRYKI